MTKHTSWYFICSDGALTLEKLFKKHRAKVIVRKTKYDGTVEFWLYQQYNAKWDNGTGWRLHDRDIIIKAIELAKKYNIARIRK